MKSLISNSNRRTERVFLVGVERNGGKGVATEETLEELAELSATAGAVVVGEGVQKLEHPSAATFIGSGKAQQFARDCKRNEVDTIIFDDELSPAQSRNLEKIFECKILDRTSLILDIFAQRARTREGKLQVELAQLQHLLPRLTRYWTHLSRQKGGIGMRGDGETQLETDRRRVQQRIGRISGDLETVRKQRAIQRNGRQRSLWPLASIVGYTNAGKSTVLKRLTGASVLVEDKLFATLDPTTRRLRLPSNQNVLLSDTVGFIRKLPLQLVEAFKATLEEVVHADLLMHVVDISHPQAGEHIEAVNSILEELKAAEKPTLMVFNKIDQLGGESVLKRSLEQFPNAVAISATGGDGVDALLSALGDALRPIREFLNLKVPHEATRVMSRLYEVGQVVECDNSGSCTLIKARVPPHFRAEFDRFVDA